MKTLLALGPILLACGAPAAPASSSPAATSATTSDQPAAPAPSSQAGPAAASATACDALSRAACLESTACTLHLVGNNYYECRPEAGVCETGLAQSSSEGCTSRAGCEFVPASCYCPCAGASRSKVPDTGTECDCVCGGGAPATCRSSAGT
ncbi:MAG: hypothetical protein KA297_07400 [Kofleriaceae bacterium]|nr:hypothetical protein [Kofleriaceae bacterium]MBP6839547.1 hypothetical protein [Kofleriaceae bacterium]